MSRGLAAVLRVRQLAERRRLADQARATTEVERARAVRAAAIAARDVQPPAEIEIRAAALVLRRLGGVAAHDDVLHADHQLLAAIRAEELAAARRVEASIEVRSVERLTERRRQDAARAAARRADQQLDDIAVQRWGRQEGRA
ncbi:hypothetical protein FTX61_18270 [Nitriliruptoraceae bacterium ZYF776]|nr:hypothetical protein [Profundirhabdus halotolerans]